MYPIIGEEGIVMSDFSKNITFDACSSIVKDEMQTTLSDDGKLLHLKVCVEDVCSNQCLMLGVLICYKGHPYALKIKQVYPDCHQCCCNCISIYTASFDFLFPLALCGEEIVAKVITHSIY